MHLRMNDIKDLENYFQAVFWEIIYEVSVIVALLERWL